MSPNEVFRLAIVGTVSITIGAVRFMEEVSDVSDIMFIPMAYSYNANFTLT